MEGSVTCTATVGQLMPQVCRPIAKSAEYNTIFGRNWGNGTRHGSGGRRRVVGLNMETYLERPGYRPGLRDRASTRVPRFVLQRENNSFRHNLGAGAGCPTHW